MRSEGAVSAGLDRSPVGRPRPWSLLLYLMLALVCLPFLLPMLWMLLSSFKTSGAIFGNPFSLRVGDLRPLNFSEVFTHYPFARQYLNSLYILLITVPATLLLSSLAGYGFARLRFPGREFAFLLTLAAMMVPSELTAVPQFLIFKTLGLTNTHVPVIVLQVFSATGALAVFLLMRPITRRALATSAGNGRLVLATLARASAITAVQSLLLVALLHLGLGVSWTVLPATLGFALVLALAFTAFHYLLTIVFGRVGLVVSLLLLAVQVTSTGGLYPVQLLAAPFQVISPLVPLTYGVQGMQGIIAGGDAGPIIAAALVLLAFGLTSVLLSILALRRVRRADALGLTSKAGTARAAISPVRVSAAMG